MANPTIPPPAPGLDGRATGAGAEGTGRFTVTCCWLAGFGGVVVRLGVDGAAGADGATSPAPGTIFRSSPTERRSAFRSPFAATMSAEVTPNLRAMLPTLSPGWIVYTCGPAG